MEAVLQLRFQSTSLYLCRRIHVFHIRYISWVLEMGVTVRTVTFCVAFIF